jgi:hypothetical protein
VGALLQDIDKARGTVGAVLPWFKLVIATPILENIS